MTGSAVSLFSGVGMFDLAVSLAGFDIIAQVEIDDYCRRVLKRHAPSYWPNAARFTDVHDFGRSSVTGAVSLIFGGFPCQPHSFAGSRQGEDDSRNLWPEFKRIIGELRPSAVLLENVPGITQAYQVDSELRPAYALTIIADLAALGYDAGWGVISAADAGAPHNRARWWCVAYANRERRQGSPAGDAAPDQHGQYTPRQPGGSAVIHAPQPGGEVVAHANSKRQSQSRRGIGEKRGRPGNIGQTMGNTQSAGLQIRQSTRTRAHKAQAPEGLGINRPERPRIRPPQSRMGRAAHGAAPRLDRLRWPARPNVPQYGWEAPRTVPPGESNRVARIKALGNGGIWVIAYALACEISEGLA